MEQKMYITDNPHVFSKKNKSSSKLLMACALSIFATVTWADDIDEARSASTQILTKLEAKKFSEVWENFTSTWFKEKTTKPAFLGNLTVIHNQLGGVSKSREIIQQNETDGDIPTGYKGKVFSFMYDTKFPGAKVYEIVVLIPENGSYKLSGFNYVPNPN